MSKKPTRNEKRLAKREAKEAKQKANGKAKKIPRQEPLPGIGDVKIAAIENAALDYAEIRDQRQELTTQEVDLKKKLLDLMHAKKLTEYKRNGISVVVKMEEETVKVRVRAEDEVDAEPAKQVAISVSESAAEATPF